MCDITNDRSMWSYLTRSKILFKSNVDLICDECCRISIKCIDVNFLKSVYGETTLPTLTSLNTMNANWMVVVYGICLLLCLISTAVTTTFGFVARFENMRVLKNVENPVRKELLYLPLLLLYP